MGKITFTLQMVTQNIDVIKKSQDKIKPNSVINNLHLNIGCIGLFKNQHYELKK